MENVKIREKAKICGVKHWEIAEALGIGEATLTRRLRRELPAKEQEKILGLIDEIVRSKQKEEER